MISYASVDRIEGEFAACEVELISFEESKPGDFETKDTVMIDIPLDDFPEIFGGPEEGDIWVVEHDTECVDWVYYKDEEEKTRRLEILNQILS